MFIFANKLQNIPMAKKKSEPAKEIRITKPSQDLMDELNDRAAKSRRTLSKEAEVLLEIQVGLRNSLGVLK